MTVNLTNKQIDKEILKTVTTRDLIFKEAKAGENEWEEVKPRQENFHKALMGVEFVLTVWSNKGAPSTSLLASERA